MGPCDRSGITLMEVLIGLVILSLGAIPLMTLYGGEEREANFVRQLVSVASHLKEVASRTECGLLASRFRNGSLDTGPRNVVLGDAEGGISLQETVTVRPENQVPGLYRVEVRAVWRDPTSLFYGLHEDSMVRLVTDPEWGMRHPPPAAGGP